MTHEFGRNVPAADAQAVTYAEVMCQAVHRRVLQGHAGIFPGLVAHATPNSVSLQQYTPTAIETTILRQRRDGGWVHQTIYSVPDSAQPGARRRIFDLTSRPINTTQRGTEFTEAETMLATSGQITREVEVIGLVEPMDGAECWELAAKLGALLESSRTVAV